MRIQKVLLILAVPVLAFSLSSCALVSSFAGQTVYAEVTEINGQQVTATVIPGEMYYPPNYDLSDPEGNSLDSEDDVPFNLDQNLDLPWTYRGLNDFDEAQPNQASFVETKGLIELLPGQASDETITFSVTPTTLKWLDVGDILEIEFAEDGLIENIEFYEDKGDSELLLLPFDSEIEPQIEIAPDEDDYSLEEDGEQGQGQQQEPHGIESGDESDARSGGLAQSAE